MPVHDGPRAHPRATGARPSGRAPAPPRSGAGKPLHRSRTRHPRQESLGRGVRVLRPTTPITRSPRWSSRVHRLLRTHRAEALRVGEQCPTASRGSSAPRRAAQSAPAVGPSQGQRRLHLSASSQSLRGCAGAATRSASAARSPPPRRPRPRDTLAPEADVDALVSGAGRRARCKARRPPAQLEQRSSSQASNLGREHASGGAPALTISPTRTRATGPATEEDSPARRAAHRPTTHDDNIVARAHLSSYETF